MAYQLQGLSELSQPEIYPWNDHPVIFNAFLSQSNIKCNPWFAFIHLGCGGVDVVPEPLRDVLGAAGRA